MEIALPTAASALFAILYLRRFASLRRQGRAPSAWRAAAAAAGILLLVGASAAPLESRFATHMVQHLLLGDLGPLLLVLGLTGPLLRPVLAVSALRALRPLAHPLVALPLWAFLLVLWHLAPLYDAALRHESVHALQHLAFFVAGTLLWAAIVEPLPGPAWFTSAWKLAYVVAMWIVSLTLSQIFIWSGHSYYLRYSLDDQRAGGGVMLVEGSFVMIGVVVWLLLRVFRESEVRQQLIDSGVAPEAAARAARYGRT
jgi:cytochrome c oxidase assembly factor CtaG